MYFKVSDRVLSEDETYLQKKKKIRARQRLSVNDKDLTPHG